MASKNEVPSDACSEGAITGGDGAEASGTNSSHSSSNEDLSRKELAPSIHGDVTRSSEELSTCTDDSSSCTSEDTSSGSEELVTAEINLQQTQPPSLQLVE